MTSPFEQLPLAVQLRDDATLENYYAGDNGLLLAELRRQLVDGERCIYLYGPAGCGRSHLLQAACHHAEQLQQVAVYLPLTELKSYPPEALLEGLEQMALVCLDDIDQVAGDDNWERALFHLYNRLQQQEVRLLISADSSPRQLAVGLEDLRSRLSWGAVFQIQGLGEAQQKAVIKLRAGNRGLQVGDEVVQFIYHRCQRDMDSFLAVLERLDQASLREQRRLTVPFVKAVMGW